MTAPGADQRRAAWPVYPVLLAAAMVLAVWVESQVSVFAVLRSLSIVVVAVAAITFLLGRLIGVHRGALAVAGVLVVMRSTGIGQAMLGLLLVLLFLATIALWLWMRGRAVRIGAVWVTGPANAIAILLLAVVVASSILNGTLGRAASDLGYAASRILPVATGDVPMTGRSVYVILLDGYPRADTLERLFEFDNTAFLDDLESRQFDVAMDSQSNYMWTALSLASMFDMRHLSRSDSETALESINDGSVVRAYRDRGYRVVASASPWEGAALRRVDTLCGDGMITEFERHLLRSSLLMPAIGWIEPNFLADRQRGFIESAFDCVVRHAGAQQQFYFGHVPTPHLPIVFQADGSDAPIGLYSDAMTRRDMTVPIDEFRAAYVEQIQYVNAQTLRAVDAIKAEDPDAVVIVMSDHGSEFGLTWTDPARSDLDERFGNFFAARTPGAPSLYDDDLTLVNVFPALLREYLGQRFPEQPNDQYASPADDPMNLQRVP